MDKIYEVLRKISSEVVIAQTTNSEYFKIGMLEVRVSDHTKSGMSTVDPSKMFILTDTGSRNLYTVCYGQDVKVCTLTEVRAICKTFQILATPLSRLFNKSPNQSLLAPKSNSGSMIKDPRITEWSTYTNPKFIEKLKTEYGFNLDKFSKSELSKVCTEFKCKKKTFEQRMDRVRKAYECISLTIQLREKFDFISTATPMESVRELSEITKDSYEDLNPQQRRQTGLFFQLELKKLRNFEKAIKEVNKEIDRYRTLNEKRRIKQEKLISIG